MSMAFSLESYAVLPSMVSRFTVARIRSSHFKQNFDALAVRALSSLVVRHGGRMLDVCAGDVCVRAFPDGGPACDVHISAEAARDFDVRVCEAQDSIHSDSGSTPAAGTQPYRCCISEVFVRLHPAVRAVVIISRSNAQAAAQISLECGVCASAVVVVSIDWLFHSCITSALRSPILYALPSTLLPLSSVRATSSGTRLLFAHTTHKILRCICCAG